MCKRVSDHQDEDLRSPIEKMEIQANTFPRYLLIPEKAGK
jgi:Zn-dependent peptidase ImmA (M78 family)